MPSYSPCTTCMVREEVKFSFRLASCCRVEVVKGGAGAFLRCFFLTEVMVKADFSISFTALSALSLFLISAFLPERVARRARSGSFSFLPPVSKPALISQYSSGIKSSISCSRSATMRTATLCTRPADRPFFTLAHSSGLIL